MSLLITKIDLFSRNSHFSFSLLGINRYYDNLEMMFGFRIAPVMKICWMFITPVFSLVSYNLFRSSQVIFILIKYFIISQERVCQYFGKSLLKPSL